MAGVKKLIDIGANLNDKMYKGIYNGKVKHQADLNNVLDRAWKAGLQKLIITGTSLEDSDEAINMAHTDERLYSTVGCHPTNCGEFDQSGDPDEYFQKLDKLAVKDKDKVVAIGEIGLDYDRVNFCPKDVQLKYFEKQLLLSKKHKLPVFLHCRNAGEDLLKILKIHTDLPGGVVHSFDGSWDLAEELINIGYYIGINGCSLKLDENLEVVKKIPVKRLLIETDSPWCEVRPSHPGYKYIKTFLKSVKKEKWEEGSSVKSRNEPANLVQVLEILSAVRNEDPQWLSEVIYNNTLTLFFNKKDIDR